MKIRIADTEEIIFEKAALADTFSRRLRGLMGVKGLSNSECLVISPCSSIHTFFMRFDIDVVFMDKDFRVLRIEKKIKPGKVVMPVKGAKYVLESDSRHGNVSKIKEGHILKLTEKNPLCSSNGSYA